MQHTRTNFGFTLIEVLVISPIVILFIGTFIGLALGLTGESLQQREKNAMAYDIQASLNDIETNAARAGKFLATTGVLQSKQGKNDDTTAFTSTNAGAPDALIFTAVATDKNPFDSTRSIVYTGSSPCNTANPVYTYTVIYFVGSDSSLYKRQVLSSSTPCATPFQKGTCSSAVMAAAPPSYCMAVDDLLMPNVSGLSVSYFTNSTSTSDPTVANVIKVTLTSTRSIAGQSITYSSDLQITGSNVGQVN